MNSKENNRNIKNTEKIDEIADAIEQSMKKGHISTLILLSLEKEPSHGYKLTEEIQKGTYGVWAPTASALYPHLSSLTEKGLIEYTTELDGKRERKVYNITLKGKEALKTIIERQQNMVKSFLSMLFSTIGITDSTIPNELEGLFGPDIIEVDLLNKSDQEKIKLLSKRKVVLSRVVDKLSNVVNDINMRIEDLRRSKE
ncbi:MAG: PadR family transcriptional regulator [Promethearchaeota archaeon]